MISLLKSQYKPVGELWLLEVKIILNSAATTEKFGRFRPQYRTGAQTAFGGFNNARYLRLVGLEVIPTNGTSSSDLSLPTNQNIMFTVYQTSNSTLATGSTTDTADASAGGTLFSTRIQTPAMIANKQFESGQDRGTLTAGNFVAIRAAPSAAITTPCGLQVLMAVDVMRTQV